MTVVHYLKVTDGITAIFCDKDRMHHWIQNPGEIITISDNWFDTKTDKIFFRTMKLKYGTWKKRFCRSD